MVGHSKGGAVALQAIVEIIKGRHNPGITTVTTLDPSISKRASFGVRLGAAASKWPWLHGRLSGEPRFDRLDIGEIRRFLLSKRLPAPLAAAGITLWNLRSTRWSSEIPGAHNVYIGGGHQSAFENPHALEAVRR